MFVYQYIPYNKMSLHNKEEIQFNFIDCTRKVPIESLCDIVRKRVLKLATWFLFVQTTTLNQNLQVIFVVHWSTVCNKHLVRLANESYHLYLSQLQKKLIHLLIIDLYMAQFYHHKVALSIRDIVYVPFIIKNNLISQVITINIFISRCRYSSFVMITERTTRLA